MSSVPDKWSNLITLNTLLVFDNNLLMSGIK